MEKKHVMIGDIDCGSDRLFLIAGPCVIEEESLMMRTAERLKGITQRLGVPLIFKSSFSKDNRSSLEYYQGPGLEAGLRMLEKIKRQFELPILTDIHYPYQAEPAAEVCDVIQIPAYLCMQSELVVEAAKTGAVVELVADRDARRALGLRGQRVIEAGRGATERNYALLADFTRVRP